MIRAVLIRVLLVVLPTMLRANPTEDAARALAAKIAAHLAANESARVTARNISSMSVTESGSVRSVLEHALPRRARNKTPVEVSLTISENVAGYLLVAEIRKGAMEAVEMVSFKPEPARGVAALRTISKRLLWEQNEAILDLVQTRDQMLVLEPQTVVRFERRESEWVRAEDASTNAPGVRDPRGRIEIQNDEIAVFLPGAACRGTSQPLKLNCEQAVAEFTLDGVKVHFTPGRNTMEGGPRSGIEHTGDSVTACGHATLASGDGGMDAPDTVALFEGKTAVSEAVELPGPVTALWPTPEGALAVVHNLSTNQYAAYALAVDCPQ
jgi:hypothetical protein